MDCNYELILNLENSFSNLFYEFIFIANIRTYDVTYVSPYSKLFKKVPAFGQDEAKLPQIVEAVSGKSGVSALPIISDVIATECKNAGKDGKPNVSFVTDLPMIINEGRTNASYRISPLDYSASGELARAVVVVGLSAGKLKRKILEIDSTTDLRRVYDMDMRVWADLKANLLTPIEKSVLWLSAQGLSVDVIAESLNKSKDAVKSVRKRIFSKLGVDNIVEAIAEAATYRYI